MAQIKHVVRGRKITADHQNVLIDQVNRNTEAIASLGGGDPTDIQGLIDSAIEAHVEAPTPHKAYDVDMPSLSIIFENGLV